MSFEVVQGGGGGRGRPPGSGDKKPRKRRFRPHPLSGALWQVIGTKGGASLEEIRAKVSEIVGREVLMKELRTVILHVRTFSGGYGWTLPHVQRGRHGKHRKYLGGLVDANAPGLVVTAEDVADHPEAVKSGTIGTLRTVVTQSRNNATGLYAFANSPHLAEDVKRELLAVASGSDATAQMALAVLSKIATA